MLRRFYEALRAREEERRARFEEFVEWAKKSFQGRLTLILFGSRARGDQSMLSDYDVLAICEGDVFEALRERAPTGVQLFHLSPRRIEEEVGGFNTIVIDAALEGRVVYDGLGVWERLRRLAGREVERRGLAKTGIGWMPARRAKRPDPSGEPRPNS